MDVFDKLWILTPQKIFLWQDLEKTVDTDIILTYIGHAINVQAKAESRTKLGNILDKNLSKVCPTYEILDK